MDVLLDGEIILNGTVGENLFDMGFTYRDVLLALAKLKGADTTVRINSGGGYADEGVAIYNALKAHKGKVTVTVEGIAASAASIIAMGGAECVMRKGSVMMIHDPLVFAMGNSETLTKAIEMLEATGDGMAQIYADKTGRKESEVRAEMREEIWLTGDEAVAKGYADRTDDEDAKEVAAFDYRAYAHAPERIVAISDQRQWSNRLNRAAAVKTEGKPTMTTPAPIIVPADAGIKAETERAAAIMDICTKAGASIMAATLIRDGVTVEAAQARVTAEQGRMTAIKEKVAQAKKVCAMIDDTMADAFIAAGSSVDAVSSELLNRIAAVSAATPQRGQHQATPANGQQAVTASWDKIVDKINSRNGFTQH